MKILLIAISLISFMYPTISYAQYNLKNIQEKFKENGAVLTPFSAPNDYAKVEEERQGPGWRYITKNETLFNNVIIYNHGHRGRKKIYRKFADSSKKGKRDLYTKAEWYYDKGVNFYGALRKQTDDITGEYGRAVEGVEVFHHLTDEVKKLHGENVNICYVGHSEGGAPVLYTSVFLDGKHVAISPSSNEYSPFKLTGKQFYESPNYYNKSKNLTILMGSKEMEWDKFKALFKKAEKLDNIETKLFDNLGHAEMTIAKNLNAIGPAVLKGCGF